MVVISSLARMTRRSGCTSSTQLRSPSTSNSWPITSQSRGFHGSKTTQDSSPVVKTPWSMCGVSTQARMSRIQLGALRFSKRSPFHPSLASNLRVNSSLSYMQLAATEASVRFQKTRKSSAWVLRCSDMKRTWPTLKFWLDTSATWSLLVLPNPTVQVQFKSSATPMRPWKRH